ncbi:O-Glycosyl hydrolase family 17 protein [Abeliophyllum distichum]|uniref:O-Glycosyl hydrolase family 17 protein n=1 Tax=Abeliophyllum distichum TaxID=126358 RepID=A0ABD1UME9_9LAMI
MVWLFFLLSLISSSTVTCQESVEFLTLHDSTPETLQSVAVQVGNQYLKNVSNSVLMAETWVRAHVLSHYPATNITSILVGNNLLCNKDQENKLGLVLPAIKNIHYSLTRWGLQNETRAEAATGEGRNPLPPLRDFGLWVGWCGVGGGVVWGGGVGWNFFFF